MKTLENQSNQSATENERNLKDQQSVRDLRSMSNVMLFYFFSRNEPTQHLTPPPTVKISQLPEWILACYNLVLEESQDVQYQITMNSIYLELPLWEQYEILAHELVHVYQENHPGLPKWRGHHDKTFISISEEIGLHPLESGAHWSMADGQFEKLMKRYSIKRPISPSFAVTVSKRKTWWHRLMPENLLIRK